MSQHPWESKPVVFLLLATVVILVGTVVTMVLPFAWIYDETDRIETVKPYDPLQLAGRDIYVREGCNNCHTQVVRPLVAEVVRYGDFSKSGEFLYDRPHLWGSRRMGPDLHRLGGKYPDAWHYQHMEDPQSMIPKSNMPAYAFLNDRPVDPAFTRRKMQVLGWPYTEEQIENLVGRTEMDAIVAYMQKLGNDIPWRQTPAAVSVLDQNPYHENLEAIREGEILYGENCAACHGAELEGGIGPGIDAAAYEEGDLFQLIHGGVPEGGMPAFSQLGPDRIWKIVAWLQSKGE